VSIFAHSESIKPIGRPAVLVSHAYRKRRFGHNTTVAFKDFQLEVCNMVMMSSTNSSARLQGQYLRADYELRTALASGRQPTLLASASSRSGQYQIKIYKHKGALNLIQVVLNHEDSKTDELNIRLLDIWQRKYRAPMKQAMEVFTRTVAGGSGASGLGAAMGSLWQWLEKSKSAVSSAIAASLGAAMSGYYGGSTLSDSVGRITEAYLKDVNAELRGAGYPPINHL
jgi:hypothetical protein